MYTPKLEKDYRNPLEVGLAFLSGKWTTRIICALANEQPLRYKALKARASGVTDAVLAATLKDLTTHGIIQRQQFNEIPLRVEYRLTDKGTAALPMLKSICQWTQQYNDLAGQVRCGCGQDNCQFDLPTAQQHS
ncbi:winged helix-turn-helix transcriptional regulator [Levilactobacillus tujiorum]|uniref:winged helix-turn-helix transcriptional regulator n=1 Tax=Levilactobacillus tujiorum TaxID=2912243 RepID=UPI0014568504|nr:helix-turn-helix domain-containing protein [Levilactobacillus tujiorum]NLR32662.1 helix-turn-helix transcriptional regulator [Levilactobacillus tujiorum]